MPEFVGSGKHKKPINHEKLAMLRKNARLVKKGGQRKKIVLGTQKGPSERELKIQQALRKQHINHIQDIDEVNMFLDDDTILNFGSKPKVQASMQSNVFVVSGKHEKKSFQEMLPTIIEQLQPTDISQLQQMKSHFESQMAQKNEGKTEGLPEVSSFDA